MSFNILLTCFLLIGCFSHQIMSMEERPDPSAQASSSADKAKTKANKRLKRAAESGNKDLAKKACAQGADMWLRHAGKDITFVAQANLQKEWSNWFSNYREESIQRQSRLHERILNQDLNGLKELVVQGTDVNDLSYGSALSNAFLHRATAIIRWLIPRSNLQGICSSSSFRAPLGIMCTAILHSQNHENSFLDTLIQYGATVHPTDRYEIAPLDFFLLEFKHQFLSNLEGVTIAKEGNGGEMAKTFRWLIFHGAHLFCDQNVSLLATCLTTFFDRFSQAIYQGDNAVIASRVQLLASKAPFELSNEELKSINTALKVAVGTSNVTIVKLLLELFSTSLEQGTLREALVSAAFIGHLDIFFLLYQNLDASKKNQKYINKALRIALTRGHEVLINELARRARDYLDLPAAAGHVVTLLRNQRLSSRVRLRYESYYQFLMGLQPLQDFRSDPLLSGLFSRTPAVNYL